MKTFLFISGIFRSGTTLLTRALAAHPQIKVVYQPFTPVFKIWRNLYFKQILKESFEPDRPMGENCFFSDERLNYFNQHALEVEFNMEDLEEFKQQLKWTMNNDSHERHWAILDYLNELRPGKAKTLLIKFMEIIDRCISKKKASVIGFKEVWCEEFFVPLLSLPGFKVLHIFRDPRSVLASRNTGRYLAFCGGKKYPLLFVARTWRRSCTYWNLNKSKPGYAWLRYEDLVLNPIETLNYLCEFLEIEYNSVMAEPSCYLDGRDKPWQPNSTSETKCMFNTSSIDYWKKVLQPKEIGIIEFLCNCEMKELGYSRVEPKFGLEDFMNFQEDESAIIKWLKKSPYILDAEQKEKELARYLSASY